LAEAVEKRARSREGRTPTSRAASRRPARAARFSAAEERATARPRRSRHATAVDDDSSSAPRPRGADGSPWTRNTPTAGLIAAVQRVSTRRRSWHSSPVTEAERPCPNASPGGSRCGKSKKGKRRRRREPNPRRVASRCVAGRGSERLDADEANATLCLVCEFVSATQRDAGWMEVRIPKLEQ
jgi:hypothetical protein